MERRIPTAAKLTMSEEPPSLTKGSVMPVIGSWLTTTPMFTKACSVSQDVMPVASRPPNESGALRATRMPW